MIASEILKFGFIAVCFIALFLWLLKYLATRTDKKEGAMFQKLSQATGFTYLTEDNIGLSDKVNGMFDFGLSAIPIQKIVHGKLSGHNVFFFESVDEAISTAHRSKFVPTWSVCLLELTDEQSNLKLMCFHKNLIFGEMKRYKIFPSGWKNFNLETMMLKKYQVVIKEPEMFDQRLCQKIIDIFSRYKQQLRGKLIPRELSLQLNGKYIAVYSDMWNFEEAEEYLTCFNFIKESLKIICIVMEEIAE